MTHTTRRLLTIAAPLVLVLAACSSDGGASAAPSEAPSAVAPSDAPSAAPSAMADASVSLADTSLGTVLVNAEGLTLYAFTADAEGVSTCYDDCAVAWPPLVVDAEPTAGEGVDPSLLTTVERTDGTTQVKYGDWPLYTFASDVAPGDVTGQGVGDKWFVIGADGGLVGQGAGVRDY